LCSTLLSTIFQLYNGGELYLRRKPEKITDLVLITEFGYNKTSLTPPLLMELPVPSQESEVFIFRLSTIFRLDFGFSFSIITSLRGDR
jgi:hypothetical protein